MKRKLHILLICLLVQAAMYPAVAQEIQTLWDIEVETASKKVETLFDAPLGASVLTREDIANSGATSIMEALRLAPGVIVRETTPGNYDIHLRGYDAIDPNALITLTSNTITLIMVNSRPVYSEFQGHTYWELLQIGIDDVEKIEIVRGPVSAMYGPNAVAGVINILTRNPDQKEGFSASTYSQAGTHGTILANASAGYNFNNGFSLRAGFNADLRDRHKEDYFVFNDDKFVPELTDDIRNQFGFPVTNPDRPSAPGENNLKERYPDPSLATNRYSFNGHARYNKHDLEVNLMGGRSGAEVQRVYAHNQVTALTHDSLTNYFGHLWGKYKKLHFTGDFNSGDNKILGSGSVLQISYSVLNSNIEYDLELSPKFSVKPGLSYRASSYNSMVLGSSILNKSNPQSYTIDEVDGDLTNSAASAFIRAEYLAGRFRLIGALRADKFKYPDIAKLSPLVLATYKATDDLLLRASYGQSSRTPFMFDLFMNVDLGYPVTPDYTTWAGIYYRGTERADEIPNYIKKDLKLLTINDAELGFRQKITEKFSVDIEFFWSELSNLTTTGILHVDTAIRTGLPGLPPTTVWVNNYISVFNIDAKPTQTGATVSFLGEPAKNLRFHLFFTIQETRIKKFYDGLNLQGEAIDADGDGNAYREFYNLATPNFTGGFNVNYSPVDKLHINLNSFFYSHQTLTINSSQNTASADAHMIFNTAVSYEVYKNTRIFINGRNLLGETRQYAFADKIGATILGGVRFEL